MQPDHRHPLTTAAAYRHATATRPRPRPRSRAPARPCTSSPALTSRSPSRRSRAPPASRGNGSTPSLSCARKSNASAANPAPPRACASARATHRRASASNTYSPKTGDSAPKTPTSKKNSPSHTATNAPPADTPSTRRHLVAPRSHWHCRRPTADTHFRFAIGLRAPPTRRGPLPPLVRCRSEIRAARRFWTRTPSPTSSHRVGA